MCRVDECNKTPTSGSQWVLLGGRKSGQPRVGRLLGCETVCAVLHGVNITKSVRERISCRADTTVQSCLLAGWGKAQAFS